MLKKKLNSTRQVAEELSLHSSSMHCGQCEVALDHVLIHSICLQPEDSTSTHQR